MRTAMRWVMVAALGIPGAVSAQDTARPRVMVAEFSGPGASATSPLGDGFARELRARLVERASALGIDPVSDEAMGAVLAASGYARTGVVAARDETALARLLRAGEVVSGSIVPQGDLFVVRATVGLSREVTLTQPLPIVRASSLAAAADSLIDAIVAARRQLPAASACFDATSAGRYAEAAKSALSAIAAYPAATIARVCLVNAYSAVPADRARAATVVQQVLAIDAESLPALALKRQRFEEQGLRDSVLVYDARLKQRITGVTSRD